MRQRKLPRNDRYFVRCEACVEGATMSARVGVDVSATGEEFRERVWAEFVKAAQEDRVEVGEALPEAPAHYVLKVQTPEGEDPEPAAVIPPGAQGKVQKKKPERAPPTYSPPSSAEGNPALPQILMSMALKPQLSKPCRLVMCLSDEYVAMSNLVVEERAARGECTHREAQLWQDLACCEYRSRQRAAWETQVREVFERNSAALDKAAVAAMIDLVKDEEAERVQFEMLASLKRAYDEYARMLEDEMASITQQKRHALTYSKTLLATAQLRNEAFHKGSAYVKRIAAPEVLPHHIASHDRLPHRWEVDHLTEDALTRKRYRMARDDIKARGLKPSVTLAPGYVASAQSLRELIKTGGYN